MKKIGLLTLATLFVISLTLSAQAPERGGNFEKRKEMRDNRKCEMNQKRGEIKEKLTPKKRAGYMAVDLELTDVQRDKLQALFEKQDKQREENIAEMKKIHEKQMKQMEEMRNANNAELEKILGPEKFKELMDKRAERMDRMKQFRKQHKMKGENQRMNKNKKFRNPEPEMIDNNKEYTK